MNPLLLVYLDRVCEPFTVDINLDPDLQRGSLACTIKQASRNIGILFVCYNYGEPECETRFVMWDVITQTQVAVGQFPTAE